MRREREMTNTSYTLGGYAFDVTEFFPQHIFDAITDIRVNEPEVIVEEAKKRQRREKLTLDGKLSILATDHPGRGVTMVGKHPLLMGDRQEFLGRALRVVTSDEFDGVMGLPDLIEDLSIVNYLVKKGGGPSFLDNKVLIGCMQRGGVAGIAGEIDDRFGAYTAESMHEMRLDGGKMMFRIIPEDERTLKTIDYCARAVRDLNRYGLVPFVEPLPMKVEEGKYKSNYTVAQLVKFVCVAAALGDSSRHTWLKIPYVESFERVAKATTLPVLMLGGPAREDPTPTIRDFAAGMRARANVRGVLVGRNVLFPGQDDPVAMALAVNGIVHRGFSAEQAIEHLMGHRGLNMDFLTRWVK
jgi:hypothetical protein